MGSGDDNGAFILLRDQAGLTDEEIESGELNTEEVYLGGLHKKIDEYGVVKEISIETFAFQSVWREIELHFDRFYPHELHIPLHTRIGGRKAFAMALNDSSMTEGEVEEIYLDEEELMEMSEPERLRHEKSYGNIVWSAQRLLERVVRNEPVLVGYKSEPHRYSGDPMLDLKPRVVRRKLSPRQRDLVKDDPASVANKGSERSSIRITLKPELPEPPSPIDYSDLSSTNFAAPKPGKWPWLTLDICLRADGFPARVEYFSGMANTNGNQRYGLLIFETGDVEILGFHGKLKSMKTNLMARKLEHGALLAFWSDWHSEPQRYRVTALEQLVGS